MLSYFFQNLFLHDYFLRKTSYTMGKYTAAFKTIEKLFGKNHKKPQNQAKPLTHNLTQTHETTEAFSYFSIAFSYFSIAHVTVRLP